MNEEQKAFEAWASSTPNDYCLDKFGNKHKAMAGEYVSYEADIAWEAWQAAIAWTRTP